MLPPGTTFIEPQDRAPEGYYEILPGNTMVFPFVVPMFGSIEITSLHTLVNSQDWSVSCWFSAKPLDCVQFAQNDLWNEHKMGRAERLYEIWDQYILPEGDPRKGLVPGQTYYMNVRNLQNRINVFQVTFSS